MVELLPRKSQRLGLRQRIELSDRVQRSTVCPGFVLGGGWMRIYFNSVDGTKLYPGPASKF